MSRFEDELREALQREQPPEGFTDRVLARVDVAARRSGVWSRLADAFRVPALRWATVAVVAVATVIGVQYYRTREIRAEGEAAKQQVMLALHITGNKLQVAQQKVRQLSSGRTIEGRTENQPVEPGRKLL